MHQFIYKKEPQAFSIQNIKSFASPVTVLYGGKTGNSKFIAEQLREQFQKYELDPTVISMSDYDVNNLVDEQYLFIVVSTRGEGDPPGQAKAFHKHLFGKQVGQLPHLNYAVCALGDSSYEHFCQTGKDIDAQLEKLGAKRYASLVRCDLSFKANAESWASSLLNKFQNRRNGDLLDLKFGTPELGPTFTLRVKDKYPLTSKKSTCEINHLILQTDHPDFTYQPGDSIRIKPKNPYSLVVKIMVLQDYSPDTIVRYNDKKKSIEELLVTKLELTNLSADVIKAYQQHTGNEELKSLLNNESELFNYLQLADVYDMLHDFPSSIEAQDLCEILNKMNRREYSIASSSSETPDEVHLCVKQFNYSLFGRDRIGACSSYINKGLQADSSLKVQLIPNNDFRLPEDEVPIIMIGAGTGIAPFISFMKERNAVKSNAKNWLIFGEKYREHDFLYQEELESFVKAGILNKMDLAFSRDGAKKVYVQDILSLQGKEIYQWLENGAHLYICGSIAMGRSILNNLLLLVQEEARCSKEHASNYIEDLKQTSRLHEDLY